MQRYARRARKRQQEFLAQLRIERADARRGTRQVARQIRPAAHIHGCFHERLIHRDDGMPVARNPATVPERLPERRTKRNAHVLHRMMRVHGQVALAGHRKAEAPVARKQHQHVIEKAAPGADLYRFRRIKPERQADIGLRRRPPQ